VEAIEFDTVGWFARMALLAIGPAFNAQQRLPQTQASFVYRARHFWRVIDQD